MLFNLLAEQTEETPSTLGPSFYLPIIIIGAVLILLIAVILIAKRKGLGPVPTKLTLKMPRATLMVSLVFLIVFVVGAVLAWFLLPEDMEYRLLTQILITVIAAFLAIIFPLNARQKLTVEGNEIAYRPPLGKEKIYSFKDLHIVVIKATGFDGNTYKYYDKNGKKLFSFSSTTPYTDNFFDLVTSMNKHIQVVDRRVTPPIKDR